MRSTHLHRPSLHTFGDAIGYRTVERSTVAYHIHQLLVYIRRKILLHLRLIEHILTEIFRRVFRRSRNLDRLFLKSRLYNSESKC